MNEIAEFIVTKIARTERDHANALAKASDCTAKAAEQRQRAEELEVLLRHLKQWGTESGATPLLGETPSSSMSPDAVASALSPTVPVRALVKTALESLKDFSSSDLVSAVQLMNPNAKKTSILSELSHCKSRRDVVHFGQDSYRSCFYPVEADDTDPFSDDVFSEQTPPQRPADAKKVDSNEPGPEFGTLSQVF